MNAKRPLCLHRPSLLAILIAGRRGQSLPAAAGTVAWPCPPA
jgi:hypothetical protein